MSEKDNNLNGDFSEFLRYREGVMTDREKNAFERRLQKDSFAEEAAEGFDTITSSEARHDMDLLIGKMKPGKGVTKRLLWYSAAASAALLAVISSVWISIERKSSTDLITEAVVEERAFEISRPGPITEPFDQEAEAIQASAEEKKSVVISGQLQAEPESPLESAAAQLAPVKADQALVRDSSAGERAREIREFTISDQRFVPVALRAKTDAELMAAYDTVTPASDEIIVVGYGKKARSTEDEAVNAAYTPPEPVSGKAGFNKYLQDNIRRPDGETEGQRVVVVTGFRVDSKGTIDSIWILRSPSKAFSDEAIRLIMEGPEWKPAVESGVRINDEVMVRIVFR